MQRDCWRGHWHEWKSQSTISWLSRSTPRIFSVHPQLRQSTSAWVDDARLMITHSLIRSPLLKHSQDRSGLSTTFQTHLRDRHRTDVIQPRPSESVHKSVRRCELADHSSKSGDVRGSQDKDDARYQSYQHLATDLALDCVLLYFYWTQCPEIERLRSLSSTWGPELPSVRKSCSACSMVS